VTLESGDDLVALNDFDKWLFLQLKLQLDSFKHDPRKLDGEERAHYIRWNILALLDEIHEALHETGWKPWATSRHFNRDNFVDEIVDALHFIGNLLLLTDVNGEELMRRYENKQQVNHDRQISSYSGKKNA
jgi:dimeric dUTPase (all-alpha-NTP-PPase superfamily)